MEHAFDYWKYSHSVAAFGGLFLSRHSDKRTNSDIGTYGRTWDIFGHFVSEQFSASKIEWGYNQRCHIWDKCRFGTDAKWDRCTNGTDAQMGQMHIY